MGGRMAVGWRSSGGRVAVRGRAMAGFDHHRLGGLHFEIVGYFLLEWVFTAELPFRVRRYNLHSQSSFGHLRPRRHRIATFMLSLYAICQVPPCAAVSPPSEVERGDGPAAPVSHAPPPPPDGDAAVVPYPDGEPCSLDGHHCDSWRQRRSAAQRRTTLTCHTALAARTTSGAIDPQMSQSTLRLYVAARSCGVRRSASKSAVVREVASWCTLAHARADWFAVKGGSASHYQG